MIVHNISKLLGIKVHRARSSRADLVKSIGNNLVGLFGLEVHRADLNDDPTRVLLSNRFKNYHLGCGYILANDFLNIDSGELTDRNLFGRKPGKVIDLSETNQGYALTYDLRKGIPAASSSLDVIYHSHLLEHLTNKDGRAFLEDCFRCLADGGTMRLAVPDFELWCHNYLSGDSAFFDWYQQTYLCGLVDACPTKAMTFSGMLYNWGHSMMYDYDTLHHKLANIGYVNIRRMGWGQSECVPCLPVLESSDSDRRVESLVIECCKPKA
jgi:predicted SAM-dependent methyltransferase